MTPPTHGKPLRRIHIGELCVSREPVVIQTLLGSCVSACLFDPGAGVGGMNHIFLPGDPDLARYDKSTRFGINAMELLINEIMKRGGDRARLRAKVFGGGHVLQTLPAKDSTGAKNIQFVLGFLAREAIPIVARDVGGHDTRVLQFHTDTGEVFLRRVRNVDVNKILDAEARLGRKAREEMERDTDITLFR